MGSIKIKKYIAELVKFQVNILSVMNDIWHIRVIP
ncbi:hypothetical protein FIC_00230 [Flavobacteriaceae bacterium 3519-10]|nr:hypothetical protein FIC_00230 [Flavobacteriaceae bacterium 3519-10]